MFGDPRIEHDVREEVVDDSRRGGIAVGPRERPLSYGLRLVTSKLHDGGTRVRRLWLVALFTIVAAPAGAQILSVPKGGLKRDPSVFVGASIGLFNLQDVFDGSTQTAWGFSQTIEYAGSLEFAVSPGSAFGVTASYAHVPMLYVDSIQAATGFISSGCCDAHVNVYTVGAQFSVGGGGTPGFHQLIVVDAGIIAFENFTSDRDGRRLQPDRNIDPRIGIGYGFDYGFARLGDVFLVQEYGVALHESKGLSGGDRRQYQQQTTRLGFKFALGR
jgi:hypothetical protein